MILTIMVTRYRANILLLLVFYCGLLRAQSVPFERYTSKNGLVSDRITSIAQDNQGFMWFGSYFGVCRYNGISFEKIKLPAVQQNKYVVFMAPADRKMYAGFLFNGGLAEIDNGTARSYFIGGKDSASANEFVCMLDEGNGNILLFNSAYQLYRFHNGKFQLLCRIRKQVQFAPHSMIRDSFNNLWISSEKGLVILPYPYQNSTVLYPEENIFSLTKREDGKIFFSGSDGHTTKIISCSGWKDGLLDEQTVLTDAGIKEINFPAPHPRHVWGLHGAKGIFKINDDHSRTWYNIPLDLNTEITALFVDRENNLWIDNEPGVLKISNFNTQFYPFSETAAGNAVLHKQNDSLLWVSNAKALYTIREDKITRVVMAKSMAGYFALLLIDEKKNLWLGSWNEGLWKCSYHEGKPLARKDFTNFGSTKIKPHFMMEDDEHNIWVGGINGLFRIRNDSTRENFHPLTSVGQPVFIVCMAIDEEKHRIWLGDNANGITAIRYYPRSNGHYDYSVELNITTAEGITDSYIRSLFLDHQKNLWVGTRFGGIYKLSEGEKGMTVKNYNTEAGLSCTRITKISEEDSTAIWFATCDGIYRYDELRKSWRKFGTSDGILNSEVYDFIADKQKGFIWAATGQGVSRLSMQPEKIVPPLVNITSITVLGKADTNAMNAYSPVNYPYSHNSIGFSFAGASFIDEKKILYRYMLQGYENNWSQPVSTNSVNYASLPPGNYVFKVMAANAKGEWSRTPAEFRFSIVMPFYQRPFFIFMMITIFIFVVYAIRIQRLRNRFRIERLRLNIAQDLHDDIGSTLGSINLLSKTAKRRLDNRLAPEEMSPIFQKIGESAENSLEAMDDIVWSINPKKDKIEDLLIRMREFAIPLFEARNIEFEFYIDKIHEQAISMNLRRNAFLIYKEAIHNVLKHAQANRVSIRLYLERGQFCLEVRDNGKGICQEKGSNRHGMKNMQDRASMINGSLVVHSTHAGTSIIFHAPVK
ncbi:MAG: two-component regulator propeller domain-containing protein [Flavisolibacter sp.]